MKKTWYKITSEEITRIYRIPAEIANDPNNHFWGLTYYHSIELFEGHLPLVILSINNEYPSTSKLQIFTADMEILREPDLNNELKNFNPLEWEEVGHYLILQREQFDELCHVLKAQKCLFADDKPLLTEQPIFRLLCDEEVQRYRLHPEWFPGVNRSYYIQVIQPALATTQNIISLITISVPSKLNNTLHLEIMTFAKDDLLDESFTPLKRSQAKLHLNWPGLLELVELLSQAVKQAN